MNNEEFITLLQQRRHDYLNQLQLIQGYLGMERYQGLRLKLNEIVESFKLEQKLFNLHMPNFTLYIIRFNYVYRNIRLTYDIHNVQADLSHIDDELCKIGQKLARYISDLECESTLYTFIIEFDQMPCEEMINVSFKIEDLTTGKIEHLTRLVKGKYNKLQIEQLDKGVNIQVLFPKSR